MSSGFVPDAVDGIAILLWSADPGVPHLLATPFFQAAAAAAMEIPVEIYFTAASVRLLLPGVAEGLHASPHHAKTVLDTMRDAFDHGAQFFACTDALHAQGLAGTSLIPECHGHGGAVQFMARAANLRWRALVF